MKSEPVISPLARTRHGDVLKLHRVLSLYNAHTLRILGQTKPIFTHPPQNHLLLFLKITI
jgi:hypothetical protein